MDVNGLARLRFVHDINRLQRFCTAEIAVPFIENRFNTA
jgi:hypothetical protein